MQWFLPFPSLGLHPWDITATLPPPPAFNIVASLSKPIPWLQVLSENPLRVSIMSIMVFCNNLFYITWRGVRPCGCGLVQNTDTETWLCLFFVNHLCRDLNNNALLFSCRTERSPLCFLVLIRAGWCLGLPTLTCAITLSIFFKAS